MEVAAHVQVMMAAVTEEVPLVDGGYGSSRVGVGGTIFALVETEAKVLDTSMAGNG